ncbi:MAG: hypothetical protein JSR37_09185 [Verrucomicrobia bacterium]|nr:hypothetical protein [Verrucomicrobiota bacterium]MBS0636956.1 hypothetical protein [Verrucomicrobiota bacterium]
MASILAWLLLTIPLEQQRDFERRQIEEAQRDADRCFSKDWISYRKAMLRKHYAEKRLQEIDEELAKTKK